MLQSVRWTKLSSAFAMVAVCVVTGCAQTQTEGKPRPRPLPPAPKNPVVAQVQVFPGQWADTDSNGYGDSLIVTAYLWSDSYQLPVTAAGTFEFVLEAAGGSSSGVDDRARGGGGGDEAGRGGARVCVRAEPAGAWGGRGAGADGGPQGDVHARRGPPAAGAVGDHAGRETRAVRRASAWGRPP